MTLSQPQEKIAIPKPISIEVRKYAIPLSLFKSAFETAPAARHCSFADLFGDEPRIKAAKGGECFSPVTYRLGSTRGNAGVEFVNALVYDYDHVEEKTLIELTRRLNKMATVFYSTHSHTADGSSDFRFRLIMLITRPLSKEEFRLVYRFVGQDLGGEYDKSASDPARIFFTPSCPSSRANSAFIKYNDGILLDVALVLAKCDEMKVARQRFWKEAVRSEPAQIKELSALFNVFSECDAFGPIWHKVKAGEVPSHWEGFSLLFVCIMIQGGVEWFLENVPGWGDDDDQKKQIKHSIDKKYAPLSCRKMGELGLCPYADVENPCLLERAKGVPRSPATFLFGKKSVKKVVERNQQRMEAIRHGK